MALFRLWVFRLLVPINVAAMAWVLMGRGLFGVALGWRFAAVLVLVLPVLVVCLGTTTVLAFRQRSRPLRLSAAQAWWQLACWLALFVFGAAIIDFVDADVGEARESVLINGLGWSLEASYYLSYAAIAAAAVAWLALIFTLVRGRNQTD